MFYDKTAKVLTQGKYSDGMGGWLKTGRPTELKEIRVVNAPLDNETVLKTYGTSTNTTIKMYTEDSLPNGDIYIQFESKDYRILNFSDYGREKILLLELI